MWFDLDALVEELSVVRALAEPFLDSNSSWALNAARAQLQALREGEPSRWAIDEPLLTKPSPGSYAQDDLGEYTVRASVRTQWYITRVDRECVRIHDNVSTSVAILTEPTDGTEAKEIARWTMDIAAVESAPGCGLHAQVKDSEHSPNWFPTGLDVPRLPMFVPTLGAVLEFVLGELFQTDWPKRVAGHPSGNSWRSLQRAAWERWLSWQQEIVSGAAISPWLDIKARRCAGLGEQ